MKSLLRMAIPAVLASATADAAGYPQTYDHITLNASPGAGGQPLDVYRELVGFRVRNDGAAGAFKESTAGILAQFLVEPASPYSELRNHPVMVEQPWWPAFVADLSARTPGVSDEAVVGSLQWQLGLTKARPGIEIDVGDADIDRYGGAGRTREAAANALKAEVDADIFWQALDMNGAHYAEAAGEAVALQILRDQMARNDPADHAALAIKPDVGERYMAQRSPQDIAEADRAYLGSLLRFAIVATPSFEDGGSARNLPTIYRVARIAAAYADVQGYTRIGGYCDGNAPRHEAPDVWPVEPGAPLCFVAAHDRAVRDWYRWQLHDEATRRPSTPQESGFSRLMHWIGVALLLVDGVAFLETADALIADDLASDGIISEEDAALAQERASRLTCGIAP